jgi:hypothetical protein
MIEALPLKTFQKLKMTPCYSDEIKKRVYLAYSIMAREMILIFQKLFSEYEESEIGPNSNTTYFSIISDAFFQYSEYFPIMANFSIEAIQKKLIESMKLKINEFLTNVCETLNLGDFKTLSFIYLFLSSDENNSANGIKIDDIYENWVVFMVLLNFPLNQNNYVAEWRKVKTDNIANKDLETLIPFISLLDQKRFECEKIFGDERSIWKSDEKEKSKCQEIKDGFREVLKNGKILI